MVIFIEKPSQWLLCPYCRGKTRVRIREDTVLQNFLLFCPKCRREALINCSGLSLTLAQGKDRQGTF